MEPDDNRVQDEYELLINSGDMEGVMIIAALEDAGIPVLTKYPLAGSTVKIIFGSSQVTGVDIYVPGSMMDQAEEVLIGIGIIAAEDAEILEESSGEDADDFDDEDEEDEA